MWKAPLQDALRPAGIQAEHIGSLWNFTLGLCALARPERRVWRIIGWATAASALGLVALLVADAWTSRALARLPLADAVNIELTGHQWWWEARYLDADPARAFTTANELHIPVGRPVLVTLRADDVIHTLWIPNLQGKKDMIPGRTATLSLRADRPGTYRGQCAEFCGVQHALMALLVEAEPNADYEAWAAAQRSAAPAPVDALALRGREVFLNGNCASCHTVAGTAARGSRGPDLSHLASRRTIGAGMFPNNRGHLGGWIADPQALKPGVYMPPNSLPPADLQALLAYLETLK